MKIASCTDNPAYSRLLCWALIAFLPISCFYKDNVPVITKVDLESMSILLKKNSSFGVDEDMELSIDGKDWDDFLTLTVPASSYGGSPSDVKLWEEEYRVATVVLSYKDKHKTRIKVYAGGQNPAVVSLDGKTFYYAKFDRNVDDGAATLVRNVLAEVKKRKKINK